MKQGKVMNSVLAATLLISLVGCGATPTLSPSLQNNTSLTSKAASAPASAQLGLVCGLLDGAINSYKSFKKSNEYPSAFQWYGQAKLNRDAAEKAAQILKSNKELFDKYAETAGSLAGGVVSFNMSAAGHGLGNASSKRHAEMNLDILEKALQALQQVKSPDGKFSNTFSYYQYSLLCGLLDGAIDGYEMEKRNEEFFVRPQWHDAAKRSRDVMVTALELLKTNQEIQNKYPETAGILSGGIVSFNAIKNPVKNLDREGNAGLANMNCTVLKKALQSLQK